MTQLDQSLFRFLGWSTQGDLGPFTFYTTRRSKLVFYVKAPPKSPPTPFQLSLRNRWRLIALTWSALPETDRARWERVSKSAHLRITGYNLFVYYQTTRDANTIRTLERQTGLILLQ